MPTNPRKSFRRTGFVERLEDRVVMSGDPLGGMLGGKVDHHSAIDPPLVAHGGDIEHHLATAHSQTGLIDVRNDYGFRGSGQTVAIIDSGIAYDHPALGGGLGAGFRVVGGRDFTPEQDNDPYDDGPAGSHGTHVAGIVGADNGSGGGSGVAPGVDLVALRVFDDLGEGYFSWVEDALQWVHANRNAFENPVTTVNLSLGTDWNDDVPPSWAMLEDELAQLEAEGIFIAVSAGNSFDQYYQPGLSYPAASPHVVPVMSTDDDGSLSYFSQRHESAIAAPGRWIYSTVPDYVGNHNGLTDDWATYSGTSMASPYLAGASVLVREAMEFVGVGSVTQQAIYDHIRATADAVFDAATQATFHRLNLEAAIDALMPADDYGSTPADAHHLGTLAGSTQLAGLVGTLRDVDFFTFTAGVSGSVTFSAATTHDLAAAWHVEGTSGTPTDGDNGTLTLEVTAGRTYTVGLSTEGGIGYYELTVGIEPSNDVVHLDGRTVHVRGTAGDDEIELALGATHSLVVNDVTYSFAPEEVARFEIHGGDGRDRIALTGTGGDETAVLRVGQLDFTSAGVDVAADSVETILIAGGGGQDTASFYDSPADDLYQTWDGVALFSGPGFSNRAVGFSRTHAYSTAGGYDQARMYDSAGDDLYRTWSTRVTMSGSGFWNSADHFDWTRGISTSGGYDEARMYDSADDNLYQAWSTHAVMHGTGFRNYAERFERTRAFSTAGGYDEARIYDTAGDDIYQAWPGHVSLSGHGFLNIAEQFERTRGFATAGGYDEARMYDTPGDDIYQAWPGHVSISGKGFLNIAENFERTRGIATAGGYDEARMYDSPGDDLYQTWSTQVALSGNGFWNVAERFEYTRGFAIAGGFDEARMYDTVRDDLFRTWQDRAVMSGSGYLNMAEGFEFQRGWSAGGNDEAYFYDSTADDHILAREWGAFLTSGVSQSQAYDFATVRVFGENGGTNTTNLEIVDYLFQLVGEWV